MTERLTTIYRTANGVQAHLLQQLLADRDVPSKVVGDSLISVESVETPVSVLVPVAHAQLARFIADAFNRHIVAAASSQNEDDADHHPQRCMWPACSVCGTKRMTACPFCGTSGADFPLADVAGQEMAPAELVLCSICDEPFTPQFHRQCANCGHRFPDGIDSAPISDETSNDIWRSLIGVVLFLAGFGCLVWWVLRS